jgi:hypothetical protein
MRLGSAGVMLRQFFQQLLSAVYLRKEEEDDDDDDDGDETNATTSSDVNQEDDMEKNEKTKDTKDAHARANCLPNAEKGKLDANHHHHHQTIDNGKSATTHHRGARDTLPSRLDAFYSALFASSTPCGHRGHRYTTTPFFLEYKKLRRTCLALMEDRAELRHAVTELKERYVEKLEQSMMLTTKSWERRRLASIFHQWKYRMERLHKMDKVRRFHRRKHLDLDTRDRWRNGLGSG